jgi:hypothetical protein
MSVTAINSSRSEGRPRIHEARKGEARERLRHQRMSDHAIDLRLRELDEEWDIERAIQANAATLALSGTVLSMIHDRRWSILPLAVTGFLLQHAVQGWCPPVPVLRRLGFRTMHEIERERHALKAMRGDYDGLPLRERGSAVRGDAAFDAAS